MLMHFTFGGTVKWTGLKRAREQRKKVLPGIGSQAYLVLWLGIFWISDEMEKKMTEIVPMHIFSWIPWISWACLTVNYVLTGA